MTVALINDTSGPFTGNGVTVAFPFTFKTASASELLVQIDGVTVSPSDYTVALNAGGNGGTITMDVAPSSGDEVMIYSDPLFSQEVGLANAGPFLPTTLDEVHDRAAIRDISLLGRISRLGGIIASGITSAAASAATAVANSAIAVSDAAEARLLNGIDPRPYGVLNADPAAAKEALRLAVIDCIATGRPLYLARLASNIPTINGPINASAGFTIAGGGTIYTTYDGPIFRIQGPATEHTWDFNAAYIGATFNPTTLAKTGYPTAACAIELASTTGTQLIERNQVKRLHTIGMFAAIVDRSATYSTPFGKESTVNWNNFDNLSNIERFPGDAKHVYYSAVGSGTGNTWHNMKGQLGAPASSFLCFNDEAAVGAVGGDITVALGHFSAGDNTDPVVKAAIDCAVVEYKSGVKYRSNLNVTGSQADSRVARVFRLNGASIDTIPYVNIKHDGLVGGSTILGIDVPLKTMRIVDRDVGRWEWGFSGSATGTGAKVVPAFKVGMAPFYGGVSVELYLNGFIGGVAAGATKLEFRLDLPDAATIVGTIDRTTPAGRFSVSFTPNGREITVNITFTPTSSPSGFDATCIITGNNFYVTRIL